MEAEKFIKTINVDASAKPAIVGYTVLPAAASVNFLRSEKLFLLKLF